MNPPAPTMTQRRRRLARGVGVAVFGLLLIEFVLRLLVPEEALLFSWERSDGLLARRNDGGWHSRPGVDVSQSDGPYVWKVRVNQDGLRSNKEFARTSGDAYRVLALGDSWIFGFSVTQDHTIPDQVGALLSRSWGREVEVLNAGVLGASALDTLQQWQAYGARYDLDAVLIGTPHNMQQERTRSGARADWYKTTTAAPASHLRLYLLLRRGLYLANPWGQKLPTWTIESGGPGSPDQVSALEDIVHVVGQARARGLAVWFADLPGNMQGAMDLERPDPSGPIWSKTMEPLGVTFAGHALAERSCWGFRDHDHPSEAGSRAVAEALVAAILAHHSAPARATSPRCDDVEGVGPGKPGWIWAEPSLPAP